MTLLLYRTRVLEAVGDPASARYSDAILDEALRLALEEYSRAVPQIKDITLPVLIPSAEQELIGVVDLLFILACFYPVTLDSAPELESYYPYNRDGAHWLNLGGGLVPQVGDLLRVIYGAAHTIQDLDAALVTTAPVNDTGLIVQGAAGHALNIYGDSIVQSYGKRTPQDDVYAAAVRRLRDFRARLKGRRGSGPVPAWSARWKLDAWDKNSR
jgi:hypothetical protein